MMAYLGPHLKNVRKASTLNSAFIIVSQHAAINHTLPVVGVFRMD